MHIPGHLAVALAQHCLPPLAKYEKALKPLLLACLFPDAVDKTIGYVFHAMPNGRHYMHNVFSLVGVSLVVGLIWGRVTGTAWFLGHLGHLLADIPRVPWFFPVKKYGFRKGRFRIPKPARLIQETVFLSLALIMHRIVHQKP